ncbi:MAG: CrcB protein [Patiriisocius sp.]|jgi:CrcB protein
MKHTLLVFLGGGLGSSFRYVISKYLNALENTIPMGTFAVNIIGSLLIGVIMGFALKNDAPTSTLTLLVATGFCGGFTTFSAFALENYQLLKTGDITNFIAYTLGSIALGILAVFIGIWLVKP